MTMPEFILRPVREDDLSDLGMLVESIAGGMTSLPDHPEYLEQRINDSLRSFDHRVSRPGSESYMFVLEEIRTGKLKGTSGLIARVGGFDPFYTYRIVSELIEYEPLGIHRNIQRLELVKNHKGPSEICSLFLHPDYRRNNLGKLLSLTRFCFMKAFPERFDEEILAEIRGYLDESGKSPFWEAVGKNFFWRDYYTADVLSGIGEKDFIQALLPEHPIYVMLLPESAREVIAKPHPQSEPALAMLLKEGFLKTDEIDIFDAGPVVRAKRNELATWNRVKLFNAKQAREAPVHVTRAIVTSNSLNYRGLITEVDVSDQDVYLPGAAMEVLEVCEGSPVQVLPV